MHMLCYCKREYFSEVFTLFFSFLLWTLFIMSNGRRNYSAYILLKLLILTPGVAKFH